MLEGGDFRFGSSVDLFGLRQRVGRHGQAGAAAPGQRRDGLPEFFGDEGHDGVGQTQHSFQRAHQGAAGCALLLRRAMGDLGLGDFQIPVAILIPDELVDGLGGEVQAVVGKALRHLLFGALQLRGDPAVGGAEVHIAVGAAVAATLIHATVEGFESIDLHQHKARGVPQLVAEIAVALAALGVEVDIAAQRGHRGKSEAQGVSAVGGNAAREFFLGGLAHCGCGFGFAQASGALVEQGGEFDAVDQIDRVEHIALALAHFLAVRVEHQTVDVNVLERHLAGEVRGHHDHPGDPEENDVEARDQHRGGQEQVHLLRRFGPAQGGEGHQCGGIPGVEHVRVAGERAVVARGGRLVARLGFAAGHKNFAVFAVPRRDLVAPPELARNAPVLNIGHPLVVGVHPVFGDELHFAVGHRVDGLLRNALAVRAGLGGGDEPLIGEHGLDDLAGARTNRHHVFVRHRFFEKALRFQVFEQRLARGVAVEPLIRGRAVFVDAGVVGEDGDQRNVVAQRAGVVVEVVRAGDFHAARAEIALDEAIGDDGNLAVAQRQIDILADELGVAFIFWMHRQRAVGHHGFGPGGGDVHAAHAVDGPVAERVEDVPHEAVVLLAFHLQIAHRALEHRVPVHQPLAAIDQALFVKLHEGLHHGFRQFVVHGEVLVLPTHRVAHAAHLAGDGVARLLLPFPHFFDKLVAPQVVAAQSRSLQLPLHHDLRGNARMVHARHPQGVVAAHAVVAH